jgi:hypothetical protein
MYGWGGSIALGIFVSVSARAFGADLLYALDNPNGAGGGFGFAMADVGDINDDTVADVLVGAFIQDVEGRSQQGQAYLFSGTDGGLLRTIDTPIQQQNANFGGAIAGPGDLNGDSVPDLVIGAGGQDRVFVFSGAADSVLYTLTGDGFGSSQTAGSVAAVGDIDGDLVADIVVGALGDNPPAGRAFAYSGATGALIYSLDDPNPVDGSFGHGVAGIGDVDGDSVPDILVGAWEHDSVGQAFAFSGTDGYLIYTIDNPRPSLGGAFSRGMAGIADVNGDLIPDLAIGDLGQDVGGNENQGAVFVFSGVSGSLLYSIENPFPEDGALFGRAITGLDDVDGDSIPDLAIAAPGQDKTYVLSGANGSLLSTLDGGGNVIAVSDVNGDSQADVAVAGSTPPRADGRVFVYSVGLVSQVFDISIDIKPGNKRNIINPRSRGNIWIAILSDTESSFDPLSQVDIPTVAFGPDGAKANRHKVRDTNKDGLGDLLLRFNIPETGIACGDTDGAVTGETFEGRSFEGTDTVKTVGCPK